MIRAVLAIALCSFSGAVQASEPVPVAELVARVDIPYQQFTLMNGLRVVVHTDRKAPIVAVSVWYHIGSKNEPRGKFGFAHLFEHLMFNGSENSPSDFFEPLQQIGGTDSNGSTSFDRTNYFETVPTGALDRILWLESDRMGYLLGAVDQTKLDNQRAVVQNEKRQGDNQPFGEVSYLIYSTLFPMGHPYHHEPIGTMPDLNAASLGDVKSWFRANYGPNNAVLVLAGDIDLATARTKVERWFGPIPRGPDVARPVAPVPRLSAPVERALRDMVPYTQISRHWPIEGVNGRDTTALDAAATILGGLSSSRLDNALVRSEKRAVSVTAGVSALEDVGIFTVSVDVKPGQDAAVVEQRLDAIIAEFLNNGPTADEVRRVATRSAVAAIGGFESVGGYSGKAVALAEGLIYSNDPKKYKTDLLALAALTPREIREAARKWLRRPALTLNVIPGKRESSPETSKVVVQKSALPPPIEAGTVRTPRAAPPVDTLASLAFPKIERATLSNGIPVFFARRTAVPVVRVSVSFDAGAASDPKDATGTQAMTLALLTEGTRTRTSTQIAEESERLGASISTGGSIDRSSVGLYAVSPNLKPSLELLADIVRNPAFAPAEVERVRGQQLARIKATLSSPDGIANYVLPTILYGHDHPYGRPGSGDAASVAKLTPAALAAFQNGWFRPDNAQIFVIGDTTLAELVPQLEATLGTWAAPAAPKSVKDFAVPIPSPTSKIYLIDRPGAGQSVILGGSVLGVTGKDDLVYLRQANDVMGGSYLSRLNTDLRETKGWSYGVGASINSNENRASFIVSAPVQADRTGDAIVALMAGMRDFLGTKGVTSTELERTANGAIRELPGQFETSDAVLPAMQRIIWLGRPDDFYERLATRYQRMTGPELDAAARAAIDPAKLVWIVVGDAASVKSQLAKTGIPVETLAVPSEK